MKECFSLQVLDFNYWGAQIDITNLIVVGGVDQPCELCYSKNTKVIVGEPFLDDDNEVMIETTEYSIHDEIHLGEKKFTALQLIEAAETFSQDRLQSMFYQWITGGLENLENAEA